jgi:hypothetical protein
MTMSTYLVATMTPMMGEHKDNTNQDKLHRAQDESNIIN